MFNSISVSFLSWQEDDLTIWIVNYTHNIWMNWLDLLAALWTIARSANVCINERCSEFCHLGIHPVLALLNTGRLVSYVQLLFPTYCSASIAKTDIPNQNMFPINIHSKRSTTITLNIYLKLLNGFLFKHTWQPSLFSSPPAHNMNSVILKRTRQNRIQWCSHHYRILHGRWADCVRNNRYLNISQLARNTSSKGCGSPP